MNRRQFISTVCLMALFFGLYLQPAYAEKPQGTLSEAPAAIPNPSTWQTTATGLSLVNNADRRTAGLGFNVKESGWPVLRLRGGVEDANAYTGYKLNGPIGIDMGQVQVPGYSSSLASEAYDWAHNQLTFNYGGTSPLQVWVSRLSPAIGLQVSANSLRLFAGNVTGNQIINSVVSGRSTSPAYPKFVAFSKSGSVQVSALSTSSSSLSGMDANWILVWYGKNSHFVDTKRPMSYSWTINHSDAYQADAPILIVFQNKPGSLKQGSSGGIELSFSTSAGNLAVMPLYGREPLDAAMTDGWGAGLPSKTSEKASWWASRLCSLPVGVAESYAYNPGTDQVTVTEAINYLNICSGGTKFAPLPPMLAIAKDSLGIGFSGPVVDGGDKRLNTEFGPYLGIENVDQYNWSISGLNDYIDSTRAVTGNGTVPAEIEQRLNAEVQKIISAGHYAPWIFIDSTPVHLSRGDMYWANPADILFHLIEVAEAVKDPTLKASLVNYIRSERTTYPPETVYNLSITKGKVRGAFSILDDPVSYYWSATATSEETRQEAFQKRVTLYSFYPLARYYDLTGDTVPTAVLTAGQTALDKDMREQDWATGYWFQDKDDRETATVNINRHFAGLVGLARLAKKAGDTQTEYLARALVAKAAITRVAFARYPRYLYSAGLVSLPSDPAWMPHMCTDPVFGFLYNYNWTGPYDDARQVVYLTQFSVTLNEYHVDRYDSPYLVAYRDLTPELGHFLKDKVAADAEVIIHKEEALNPHWFAAYQEATLGREHNLTHPIDSFQIFMAKAWIQKTGANSLARFTDMPWLDEGDLFYVQKLAETAKAYMGVTWRSPLEVSVGAGDRKVFLSWVTSTGLQSEVTWQIEYTGPAGNPPSPISIQGGTSGNQTISNLTNYVVYTFRITARDSSSKIVASSDPLVIMPSDRIFYLPLLKR